MIKDIGLDETWIKIGTILILLNKQELKIGKQSLLLGKKMAFVFLAKMFFTMVLVVNVL